MFVLGVSWPRQQATLSASPVELSFLVPVDEVKPWEGLSEDFQRKHPDIRINVVTNRQQYETTDIRKNAYALDFELSPAQYDLVYMDTVWTPDFAGRLQDLTSLAEADSFDVTGFLESELEAGKYEGRLYRLPMRADIGLLYYRKDLLEEIGAALPSTLAELEQVSDLLTQRPDVKFGYLWQSGPYEGLITTFIEVMNGFGGQWVDPATNQVGLTKPETVAAARLLRSLVQRNISPVTRDTRESGQSSAADTADKEGYVEQSSLDDFMNEGGVFLRGWPSFWSVLTDDSREDSLKGKIGIALPFSFTSADSVGCRGGWGFGIPTNAAYPDEAWTAIKYFTSEAAQKKFTLASGFLPSRRALFEDDEIREQYPHMPRMLDYLENSSVSRPLVTNYGAASDALKTALSDIINGNRSVDEAMAEAQAKTRELLNLEGSNSDS
nr:extracellular solute-binding protein [cf. Phormidesmis sp. LEGE 11477]